MALLENLIKSKFLTNLRTELKEAKRAIIDSNILLYQESTHYADRETARQLYYEVCESYGFFDILHTVSPTSKLVHYIHSEQFIFAVCRSKSSLKQAIYYALSVNGDVPVYTHKHKVNNHLIHTVLFDTTFIVSPPSPN
jgi:hypothetical protein